MLNRLITSTIVLTILFFPFNGNAQTNELKNHLNEKEIKKLSSSEKLIIKGNKVIDEVRDLEEEVEALKNAEGRIKTGKINKRNKKIAEAKLKAAIFYEEGYGKHIDVLDKRIKELENNGNSEASETRNEVKSLEKKAKKQYNKSERLSSLEDMIEMIELAQNNQSKAIEIQEKFLLSVLANQSQEQNEVAEVVESDLMNKEEANDSTSIVTKSSLVTEEGSLAIESISVPVAGSEAPAPAAGAVASGMVIATVAALPEESDAPAEEIMNQAENEAELPVQEEPAKEVNDVFLTIQFLADKEKATEAKLIQAYNGNLEIIEKTGGGWFRYSAGKFTDVAEAREAMQNEGIKGFIVAYNKDERISVKEALELINNQQ